MATLNRILGYTLRGKTYAKTGNEESKIADNFPYLANDWSKSTFESLKQNIRKHYARRQKTRCAYCRVKIAVEGYGYPIEHITCRDKKPNWMFANFNLVVSCVGCNSSKGVDNVLVNPSTHYGDYEEHCPDTGDHYRLFNPHFDNWCDHFEIEDDFFLIPKPNTKGPFTFDTCNMHRYQIILDFREQINLREQKTFRNITKRIRKEKNEDKLKQLLEAKDAILDMIENH
ncbi:hypothetical protein GCM10011506_21810 [Marivirga lumbricoides]|uniref:TIGR02646 family protein n=1 Tax=Marivirga lumbricoides TaxID=1046115 RepID=A0ABQ1M700_9BACT|nr:hypothetical protein GCM10011506_21810 [Marivirga lumbricoides]